MTLLGKDIEDLIIQDEVILEALSTNTIGGLEGGGETHKYRHTHDQNTTWDAEGQTRVTHLRKTTRSRQEAGKGSP